MGRNFSANTGDPLMGTPLALKERTNISSAIDILKVSQENSQ